MGYVVSLKWVSPDDLMCRLAIQYRMGLQERRSLRQQISRPYKEGISSRWGL